MEKLRITLEAARVNAGLLQKDVCKQMGISLATLVNWENYRTSPTADKAQELARLYGLDLGNILFCKES